KSAEDLIRLSGFPHCILRLTNVYGPGTRPHYNSVIGTFCDQAVRGRPVTLHGDGRQGRDFIYIDDVVDALIHAGTASATSRAGIFNLSSGKVVSLKQIVTQIRQAGANLKVEVHPDVPSG
ncbi:MAG: NAD-dependent epimerase/dehydratase family protein, partial [Nitrospinaceae bacterium]|nr:NAD-dependent epimerase/dehydratase family protein [Nitrospinaceae bacterium]NIR54798.1 NAD-dependent epimerase/dehydratase family protein [Nitrospinaceae bacterium]NIS85223.1 NAD-dependent epimerase/dehydratase family protein [Nitrospinaceae bacterium]NIT82036.1 NAD-dependent epimerase/dehydratase family protein [Nitrospinaceae bacterium]NIU44297.1 NAD-dependent epimerase/dehydratase family protein [Nitrospinaceae bacterium]